MAIRNLISIVIILALSVCCSSGDKSGSSETEIEKGAREIVSQLMNEQYVAIMNRFDATMKANVTQAQLERIRSSLISQCGEYERQGELETFHEPPYDIVYVQIIFSDLPYWAKVITDQSGKIAGLRFTPTVPKEGQTLADYVDLNSFIERGGEFGVDPWKLPAIVSFPKTDGNAPAVILVQRHGPYDKDETIGANAPFFDLAGGLASQGVAVMRYDNRAFAHPEILDTLSETNVQIEIIRDIHNAVQLLRMTTGIDSNRVFVLGHGQAGELLPRVAEQTDLIAGYIALGAPARPFHKVLLSEIQFIYAEDGNVSPSE